MMCKISPYLAKMVNYRALINNFKKDKGHTLEGQINKTS